PSRAWEVGTEGDAREDQPYTFGRCMRGSGTLAVRLPGRAPGSWSATHAVGAPPGQGIAPASRTRATQNLRARMRAVDWHPASLQPPYSIDARSLVIGARSVSHRRRPHQPAQQTYNVGQS